MLIYINGYNFKCIVNVNTSSIYFGLFLACSALLVELILYHYETRTQYYTTNVGNGSYLLEYIVNH